VENSSSVSPRDSDPSVFVWGDLNRDRDRPACRLGFRHTVLCPICCSCGLPTISPSISEINTMKRGNGYSVDCDSFRRISQRILPTRFGGESRSVALTSPEPRFEWMRIAMECLFIDNIALQHEGLQRLLRGLGAVHSKIVGLGSGTANASLSANRGRIAEVAVGPLQSRASQQSLPRVATSAGPPMRFRTPSVL
jgi:hypothetical protein